MEQVLADWREGGDDWSLEFVESVNGLRDDIEQ